MFRRILSASLLVCVVAVPVGWADQTLDDQVVWLRSIGQLVRHLAPPKEGAMAPPFTVRLSVEATEGLPSEIQGAELDLAVRLPDRLRLEASVAGQRFVLGRDGESLWLADASSGYALDGRAGRPLFAREPERIDQTTLGSWRLPFSREELFLFSTAFAVIDSDRVAIDGRWIRRMQLRPLDIVTQLADIPSFGLDVSVCEEEYVLRQITYRGADELALTINLQDWQWDADLDEAHWSVQSAADQVEPVALAHLTRFARVAMQRLVSSPPPPLGPAQGTRVVIARSGKGRLEDIDGTRVLFLKGTPEEMGHQHGTLLRDEIHDLVEKIVYGVGVGSSIPKRRWFFDEIDEAQQRSAPFVDPRHMRELDALANAAGLSLTEIHVANFFPELFHCSGFAVFGEATADGTLYHGRILDYLKGMGLEENAVIKVFQPDEGHAWVSVGYAGFIGTVTAMNEAHVAIGEMGGSRPGYWDGKPMAFLMREVVERSSTLEEGLAFMESSPRTCEFFYVLSDGKTREARGIHATSDLFEAVRPGSDHPLLPRPVTDAVLLSSGSRYDHLVDRVEAHYGQIDATQAKRLMKRPVAMGSNIQTVLFAPETLDFWVAQANVENVASHARFTHYNWHDLLQDPESAY